MIVKVSANHDKFRTVEFSPGFNVVLAERTEESSEKDTRNGLGKTTLLNIIHFCLGAKADKGKGLRISPLEGWEFHLDFRMRNQLVSVSRLVDKPGHVKIAPDTDCSNWPIQPEIEHRLETYRSRVAEWNSTLGWGLYDMDVEREKYSPSFRALVSYDIRRDQFADPFLNNSRQFLWDTQVHNAYMLDLNWKHAARWQELRDRTKNVNTVRRALKEGDNLIANMVGTVGELEYARDRLQRQIQKTDADLRQFRVHPKYEDIENDANILTAKLHDLANHILQLKRLIEFHRRSVEEAQPAEAIKVSELYEEAGASLPDLVKRRLEDVRLFHVEVTRNRRRYLESEAARLESELDYAISEQKTLSTKQAKLMMFLDTHGALEDYNELLKLNQEQQATLEAVEMQIEHRRQIDNEQSEIKIEQGRLNLDARRDLDERHNKRLAAEIFNANSECLYERPGAFIADIIPNSGFKFRVEIERAESHGVSKMKVFCYDLMRAELWSKRNVKPGFLIHDSNIFSDVDERQVARALELGARKARECGFQYIVCLNSDSVPYDEFTEGFDIDKFVRRRLTDNEPAGTLLGIEF